MPLSSVPSLKLHWTHKRLNMEPCRTIKMSSGIHSNVPFKRPIIISLSVLLLIQWVERKWRVEFTVFHFSPCTYIHNVLLVIQKCRRQHESIDRDANAGFVFGLLHADGQNPIVEFSGNILCINWAREPNGASESRASRKHSFTGNLIARSLGWLAGNCVCCRSC